MIYPLRKPNHSGHLGFSRKEKLIKSNRIEIEDLDQEDFKPAPGDRPGMSARERQWKQVEKIQRNDETLYFDSEIL